MHLYYVSIIYLIIFHTNLLKKKSYIRPHKSEYFPHIVVYLFLVSFCVELVVKKIKNK